MKTKRSPKDDGNFCYDFFSGSDDAIEKYFHKPNGYVEATKIKVIELNPPTKKEAEKKIKELSKFLSSVWHTAIRTR